MNIKIIVATHKAYKMPEDPMYLPLEVGSLAERNLGFEKDCTGENISGKNANYCELTGLYWAWKNLDAEYIGLCHYRRHFKGSRGGDKWQQIMTLSEAEEIFAKVPVILPKKRDYFIENNYDQYAHAHHACDLDETRKILCEEWPDYIKAFDESMKLTSGHKFNMLVMRKDILDGYCSWLFDVLFKLEKRIDITGYSDNDKRVFGFVSERLLDVWIRTNNIEYKEIPVLNMESQHWLKKGTDFLKRKFRRKRG